MATLTLRSIMPGITVRIAVEVEQHCINTSDPGLLTWFIAHHWAHNGGYGVNGTSQAWLPVYGEEVEAFFWLHVDDFLDPKSAMLVPFQQNQANHPIDPNATLYEAAEFVRLYILMKAQQHQAELAEMNEEERLAWCSEFLYENAPWGELFIRVVPLLGDSKNSIISAKFIDGSMLFLTMNGPVLNLVDPISPPPLTDRSTRLEDIPTYLCRQA